MDLLRRNVFWIVSGVVALVGIGLGVTGLRAMPAVMQDMESAATVFRNLDGLQSATVNERALQAEQERIKLIQDDYRRVMDRAKELYNYEPLVPEALPDGPPLKQEEFRKKYVEAFERLYADLNCGGPATPADVAAMRDRRANEIAAGVSPPGGPPLTPAGVLTESGLRDDPAARAAIAKALSFSCFCVRPADEKPPEAYSSLQFEPAMRARDLVAPPDPFDVWVAQVGYWIQKDVVDAIGEVNQQAAQRARARNENPWVGNMAVKDVVSIRLSQYVPPSGDLVVVAKPGDFDPGLPPGTGESMFTQSKSGQQFEVVQFTVKLVMDVREVPVLVEKLTNNRFHTLVRAAYKALPPNRELKGKIYGSAPVVSVVLDFETIMLGEVFRPMMPSSVCDHYAIPCPNRE